MSDEIGTYSFLPWLRQGLGNNVQTPTGADSRRGQVTVTLNVTATGLTNPSIPPINKTLELYGPGDIIGIDPKTIVKTEPRNWITNFEPNYLPYIEFYDEDFPWRYTPSAAAGARLIPWLTLVVLTEEEFEDGKNILNRPLPYFTLKGTTEADKVFPGEEDLWAWAHVHINRDIVGEGDPPDNPVSSNEADILNRFKDVLNENPDLAYSRIMSSRKLGENIAYHAFLIPTFESGRLAGLGANPDAVTGFGANSIAWKAEYPDRPESKAFPYYYRWYFRTGSVGDFEYLVRLLKPKVADSRVGRRDIDVLEPGLGITGITDERLKGILRLGGALQVPVACLNKEEFAEYQNYDKWFDSYPHLFQRQLAAFINLADEYTDKPTAEAHQDAAADSGLVLEQDDANDPDPLITPPLYGRWHALTSRLLTEENGSPVDNNQNWVHDINLDPRWRVAAGFGTNVIQNKQEEYMDAAWDQVGDVVEANRRLGWARLARFTSQVWYQNNMQPKPDVAIEKYLRLTQPLQKRVITNGKTVFHSVKASLVPHALTSAPMRRITRPRGKFIRRLNFDDAIRKDNLIDRVNREQVTPAPARLVPDELVTHDKVSDSVLPTNVPKPLLELLSRYPWLQYVPLVLGAVIILLLLLTGIALIAWPFVTAVAAAAMSVYLALQRLLRAVQDAEVILPEQQTPASVDRLPSSPNFRVTEFGDPFVPSKDGTDTPEAVRFKRALRTNFDFVQRSAEAGKPPTYTELDIPGVVKDIVDNINPALTIPRYVLGHVNIPQRILDAMQEDFVEAMAYPQIDVPMYEPLLELSSDHFVPNINLIEQNSITLLETNQHFIESYMVGVNHEFARELLWREYPTDQRGSYFRQFWDVSGYLNKEGLDPDALREKLRDIPPIHRWQQASNLGDHDHREEGGEKENEVVLVIRGELLKKYPTAEVYAHHAVWSTDADGNRQLDEPRDFETGPAEVVIKTPLYEAKIDPDIYFFGFDLKVTEAKGDSGEEDDDDAGWFFVIKERSGEPRFGLDVPGDASDFGVNELALWNQLAWSHVMEDVSAGNFMSIHDTRTIQVSTSQPLEEPVGPDEIEQQAEDAFVQWSSSTDAAELAYILYQVPVLIGIHAAEMLPDECKNIVEE
jgi:hypothetical protein